MTDDRLKDENDRQQAAQHERSLTQRPFRDNELAMRKVLPFEERAAGGPGSGGR